MDGCRSQNPAYRPAGPPIAQRRLLRRLHVRGPRLLRGLLHRGLLALLAALLLFLLLRGGVLLGGGILLLGCAPAGGHRREGPGGGARSVAQGGPPLLGPAGERRRSPDPRPAAPLGRAQRGVR